MNEGNKITVEGKLFTLVERGEDEVFVAAEVGTVDIFDVLQKLNHEKVRVSIEVLE